MYPVNLIVIAVICILGLVVVIRLMSYPISIPMTTDPAVTREQFGVLVTNNESDVINSVTVTLSGKDPSRPETPPSFTASVGRLGAGNTILVPYAQFKSEWGAALDPNSNTIDQATIKWDENGWSQSATSDF